MPTPTKTPDEIAENFRRMILETARRSIAMSRHFKTTLYRWRRVARSGPNANLVVVLVWNEGEDPTVAFWPLGRLDRMAAEISDAEVYDELKSRSLRFLEADQS